MNASRSQPTSIVQPQPQHKEEEKKEEKTLIIKLKEEKPKPRVSWTEDTINNQGMNKKKSNLCCIYHRPGEESSDTCTSDDQGNALERDRHTKHLHKKKCSKLKKKREEEEKQQQGPPKKEE